MGYAMRNQLTTALSNAGNIKIVEYDYYGAQSTESGRARPQGRGRSVRDPRLGHRIQTRSPEAIGSSTGGRSGGLGAALGVAGAIAGIAKRRSPARARRGQSHLREHSGTRTGSVAMDLKIVNPRNGRLEGSVVANGSFTSESAASGFSMFGMGKASNAYARARSVRRNRAAMNFATQQITDRLSRIDIRADQVSVLHAARSVRCACQGGAPASADAAADVTCGAP
jgi:curli biogenesis system outer membrane secretion channel CsgG